MIHRPGWPVDRVHDQLGESGKGRVIVHTVEQRLCDAWNYITLANSIKRNKEITIRAEMSMQIKVEGFEVQPVC